MQRERARSRSLREDYRSPLTPTGLPTKARSNTLTPGWTNVATLRKRPRKNSVTKATLVTQHAVQDVVTCTKLSSILIFYFGIGYRWLEMLFRLVAYVIFLFPALLRIVRFYFKSTSVVRSVRYGNAPRNKCDIYLPNGVSEESVKFYFDMGKYLQREGTVTVEGDELEYVLEDDGMVEQEEQTGLRTRSSTGGSQVRYSIAIPKATDDGCLKPVVVLVFGGAWIIGYKAWGALLAKALMERGVLCVCVDYRNFPQATCGEMVGDVDQMLPWVLNNIQYFGGDPENVHLVGQSAGAHISALAMLLGTTRMECAERDREDRTASTLGKKGRDYTSFGVMESLAVQGEEWVSQIQSFIGVSGPYCPVDLRDHFHTRGLYRTVFDLIMEKDLEKFSPTMRVNNQTFHGLQHLPPVLLLHGTRDVSCPMRSTTNFGAALERGGAKDVRVKYYDGKSHTDPIMEDPMAIGDGFDPLLNDILSLVNRKDSPYLSPRKGKPLLPKPLIELARMVSPF